MFSCNPSGRQQGLLLRISRGFNLRTLHCQYRQSGSLIIMNRRSFKIKQIEASVLQSIVLGPVHLVYINDIPLGPRVLLLLYSYDAIRRPRPFAILDEDPVSANYGFAQLTDVSKNEYILYCRITIIKLCCKSQHFYVFLPIYTQQLTFKLQLVYRHSLIYTYHQIERLGFSNYMTKFGRTLHLSSRN